MVRRDIDESEVKKICGGGFILRRFFCEKTRRGDLGSRCGGFFDAVALMRFI